MVGSPHGGKRHTSSNHTPESLCFKALLKGTIREVMTSNKALTQLITEALGIVDRKARQVCDSRMVPRFRPQ